jgi:pimeloyl-ACP methyl ester carboxylesterase
MNAQFRKHRFARQGLAQDSGRRHALRVLALPWLASLPVWATPVQEVGVVVMHGKGGHPSAHVNGLAQALERSGHLVANLEMPWSRRRQYDVDLQTGVAEVTRALDAMRARGARKLLVVGHSQGGAFAMTYAGLHKVDGVVAIAPGGQVDSKAFADALSRHVREARSLVEQGRGQEVAAFEDYEGSRGTNAVRTTAAIYLSWFDPAGLLTTKANGRILADTPVLFIAPTGDYPGLQRTKDALFRALPPHRLTRLHEPYSEHLHAPANSIEEISRWVEAVTKA